MHAFYALMFLESILEFIEQSNRNEQLDEVFSVIITVPNGLAEDTFYSEDYLIFQKVFSSSFP